MKFTFILFAFFINFSHPYFIKAEEIIDSSNNQLNRTFGEESSINKVPDFEKMHIVKVGDTITSISKLYSIEKELIINLNNLKDENYIYVGQNLNISDSDNNLVNQKMEKDEGISNYHVIQNGESLTEISSKYGLSSKYLIEINDLNNPNSLEVGSKLLLKKKNINNQKTSLKIREDGFNQLITKDKKAYGPISTQQNELMEVNGRKILNVLNQSDKELIMSVNCKTNELDVKIPGRKWSGWMPAKKEFEKNLLNDFC